MLQKLQLQEIFSRRMRKSTVTFFILFIAVIAFLLPNTLFVIISGLVVRLLDNESHPVHYVLTVCNFAMTSLAFIADLIIIMRNPDAREALASVKKHLVQKWQNRRQQPEPLNQCHQELLNRRQQQNPCLQDCNIPVIRSGNIYSSDGISTARLEQVDTHNPPLPLEASDLPDSTPEISSLPTEAPPPVEASNSSIEGRDSLPGTSSLPTGSSSPVKGQDPLPEISGLPTEAPPPVTLSVDMIRDSLPETSNLTTEVHVPSPVEAFDSPSDSPVEAFDLPSDSPVEAIDSPSDSPVEASDSSVKASDSSLEASDSPVETSDSSAEAGRDYTSSLPNEAPHPIHQ
jgi:hypothetical protein